MNFDLNRERNEKIEAETNEYTTPELHEIGQSRDLVRGASCCGPYDGRGYYPQ